MTPERWQKVEALYHAAREREGAQRAAFLADACRSDEELRRRIERMLEQDSGDQILDQPAADLMATGEIEPGTSLGPYRIEGVVGSGGMGHVYRARDPRMGRSVAIKVSSSRFNQRFDREVRAIASLNHPNICQIYDVGPDYLVMELVEGETLSERLERGPLAFDEALPIARQIADALEAAHENGIVHRDLKPGNIMLKPDGSVKVLDFGLAKADRRAAASRDSTATGTMGAAEEGLVMGTPHYMSPEQAQGQAIDRRSDIYAFGVVLYEMVTGRRLHGGEGASGVLASVIKEEPEWSQVPLEWRGLLRRCLEKNPNNRLRHIGDAMELVSASPETVAAPGARRVWFWPAAAAVCALVAVGAFAFRPAPQPEELARFQIPVDLRNRATTPTISPDGRNIAFVADDSDGQARLWIRQIGSLEPYPLPGTAGVQGWPFWSWDSQFVVYSTGTQLLKIALDAAAPQPLAALPGGQIFQSGFWTPDDRIVFAIGPDGVHEVPAGGGAVTPLHPGVFPTLLPDNQHYTYLNADEFHLARLPERNAPPAGGSGQPAEDRVLFPGVFGPAVYSEGPDGGYLLYLQAAAPFAGNMLVARPFNWRTGEFDAQEVSIAQRVPVGGFSVSSNGRVVYATGLGYLGSTIPPPGGVGVLKWVDRSAGQISGQVGDAFPYSAGMRISPDGTQVAVPRQGDIWVIRLATGEGTPITDTEGLGETFPHWSGSDVVFARQSGSTTYQVLRKPANGAGAETLVKRLEHGSGIYPYDLSSDEAYLLMGAPIPPRLYVLPVAGGPDAGGLIPVVEEPEESQDRGSWSPNGRFIAYDSAVGGTNRLYVVAFDRDAQRILPGRWTVSANGGRNPHWSADGTELFYQALDGQMMAVAVDTAGEFSHGTPRILFRAPDGAAIWDVTPDGQRFLFLVPEEREATEPYRIIFNWSALLE